MSETNAKSRLGPLSFVFLVVPDMAAARAFYVETLGMEVETESPQFLQLKQPGGAGASLGIGVAEGQDTPQTAGLEEIWWTVEDTDAVHAALVEKGVRIVAAPKDQPFGRTCSFADPAGNILNVFQPR